MLVRLSRREIWLGISLGALVLGIGLWRTRWHIGGGALEIVDPAVRQWVTHEVRQLSDGAYIVAVSPLVVDAANHRVTIDTLTVTTDAAANARRKSPLPAISLRFRHCVIDAIDLATLAAGHGLHAARAGCDSTVLAANVPASPAAATPSDSEGFLALHRKLDLPRELPEIQLDTVAFPEVQVTLTTTARDGRQTTIALDRLSMHLDGTRYDPSESVKQHRPLLSRNAAITLDGFDESRTNSSHFGVRHLTANLSDGTFRAEGVIFEPLGGRLADSLGFTALKLAEARGTAVDWRAFLTRGDIRVGRFTADSPVIRITMPAGAQPDRPAGTIERTVRTLGREVRVGALELNALAIIQFGARKTDSAVTTVRQLTLAHLSVDNDAAGWATALPMGALHLTADRIFRQVGAERIAVARLDLDAMEHTLTVDSLLASPEGDDSAFKLRQRYRHDRQALAVRRVAATGVDLPAFLDRGVYVAHRVDVTGFVADVLTDNSMPPAPGPHSTHQPPQQILQGLGFNLHLDTVTVVGRLTYRERAAAMALPGVLAFDAVRATILNVYNDSNPATGAPPLHFVGDAKFMGAGAFHLELELPLATHSLGMLWSGSLGPMPAVAMDSFVRNADGMEFTDGTVEAIHFNVKVTAGRATGVLSPRWRDLHVSMPGIAHGHQGLVAGIQRSLAAFAANAFVIRASNSVGTGDTPVDAAISHPWNVTETLPEFLWNSLRDPLLSVLKKGRAQH